MAEDVSLPLLERVRSIAFFASNLDEFFMVRVAGLKRRIAAGMAVRAASGMMPRDVLEAIWTRSRASRASGTPSSSATSIVPEPVGQRHRPGAVGRPRPRGAEVRKRFFKDRVFPVLTPLAVDPAHPFPYISGLSLNMAVLVRNPKTGKEHFARVKVPPTFNRFVALGNQRFVPLEDVIGEHLKRLFPGMEVLQFHTFRVTRNEDLEVEEDDAENLLAGAGEGAAAPHASARRCGSRSRSRSPRRCWSCSISELGVSPAGGGPPPRPARPARPARHRRPAARGPQVPRVRADAPTGMLAEVESSSPVDVFEAARRHDVLLHHPYDSFATSVQRFLEQAAADPHVLAIKQTLYRTSGDSPIIDALVDAAESGKQVLALIEIKARFDESANIRWARKLEHAGCHVVYGLVGLKTHCKLAMVVRDEPDGHPPLHPHRHRQLQPQDRPVLRGPRPDHHRRGDRRGRRPPVQQPQRLLAQRRRTTQLLVAPDSVRDGLVEQIHREIDPPPGRAGRRGSGSRPTRSSTRPSSTRSTSPRRQGCPCSCWCAASARCAPAYPGLSETIEVRSILGRFLEHSRVFWFENGGEPEAWIGSADLMHRNLDRRVEVLVRLPGAASSDAGRRPARPGLRPRHPRLGAATATVRGRTTTARCTSRRR